MKEIDRVGQADIWKTVFPEGRTARTKFLKEESARLAYLRNSKEAGVAVAKRAREMPCFPENKT